MLITDMIVSNLQTHLSTVVSGLEFIYRKCLLDAKICYIVFSYRCSHCLSYRNKI